MTFPMHLWLTDEGGTAFQGSSRVEGREGSIEVLSLTHGVHANIDGYTGRLVGSRAHKPLFIEKEIDRSTPLLYRAVATGETLQSAQLRWYRINEAGCEEEYFNMFMRNVKITSVSPRVQNFKEQASAHRNHFEFVEIHYGEITWTYLDGNLRFKDAWSS